MRTVVVTVLALVGVAILPAAAHACSIAAMPAKERIARADKAIFGEVLSRKALGPSERGVGERFRYRFRVIERYKGRTRPRIRLTSHTDSGTCGIRPLKVGARRGLLLHGKRGPWAVGLGSFISRSALRRDRPPKRV